MSEETRAVEPAMTNEEWARQEVEMGDTGWFHADGVFPVEGGDPLVATGDLYVGEYDEHGTACGGAEVPAKHRHALAALCLHGQRYGFSWADVDALHIAADACEDACTSSGAQWATAALSIANRIAALLPPRP